VKESTIDSYYWFARRTPLRQLHNLIRPWRHYWRYGVKSTFMFHAIELEVNSACNRKCEYCPNVSTTRPRGHMKEPLFEKVIAELSAMDFDGIVSYHFYGEPLLDDRLPRLVEHTARMVPKCRPVIYSNGDFLTVELFREYITSGLYQFWITQHDNSMPSNLRRILEEATPTEREHIHVHFGENLQLVNRSGLITTMKSPRSPLRTQCDWPLATMVITMTGNVVLCCNDYFETEVVGNVATQSLRDVWCSDRFECFRRALANGDRTTSKLCVGCDYVPRESELRRIVAY
jgi:radical SAM protein with 4Fe4S-binding SPASM domain